MTLSASLLISSLNLGEITYLPKDGDRSLAAVGPPLVSIVGEPVNCYLPRELSFISLWDGSSGGRDVHFIPAPENPTERTRYIPHFC